MSHPKQLLQQLKAGARKSLSQNFMTSPFWAQRLTDFAVQGVTPTEYWEIGPGLGALTGPLLSKIRCPLHLFEYDRKLVPYLRSQYPQTQVHEQDFLKQDLSQFSKNKIVVISNLPYHISSQILFKLLDIRERFLRLVLTFQKEFGDRLTSPQATSDYGALSVLTQATFNIHSLGTLPPGAFYPAPGVSSEALLFVPKRLPVPWKVFRSVVKSAFEHRRKKVVSNLKNAYPGKPIEDWLIAEGVAPSARAQELSVENFLSITRYLVAGAKPAFEEKNGSFVRDEEDEQKARRRGP